MAPCIVDTSTKAGTQKASALNLASIRKAIPAEAFVKSFWKSLGYMLFDYAAWATAVYFMSLLRNSTVWHEHVPFWLQCFVTFVYWNIVGFFMWCIFMIGHDCGHTNFCDSERFNDIVGHIAHGSILVPYHPWQVDLLFGLILS